MKKLRKKYSLLLVLAVFFSIILFNSPYLKADSEREIPSLAEVYADYFPIGTAVNSSTIKSHQELIEYHFNSLTAENEMKFDHLQPHKGNFTFGRADEIVELARRNNMKVRGHVLVWHSQTPAWVFQENGQRVSREELLERMRTHIRKVVGHFKGDVYAWDVVNEAISDNPNEIYRSDNPWFEIIGEEYIAEAFRAAHEADPDARLFYNDYNAIQPQKRDKIYNMLKKLLDDGVPIHGVGIQGHWDISSFSSLQLMQAIEKYASLGLEVQITELDISVYAWGDNRRLAEPDTEMLQRQSLCYKNVFNICKRYPDVVTGITLWGVADDSTWKDDFPVKNRKDWPLLFDENHQPKEAFWELIEANK
ncbi:MAG: endo-1,4-beta-xylanase [Halanaerobiaceae bacterium]|nr:endo-1,4-beta-xylanase [Halanaerobiaceae bacterium]